LLEYARTELRFDDSLCCDGIITLEMHPASRPLEQVNVTATGPFASCVFPVIWSRGMVTVRRIDILVDDGLLVCYEP
jgi:hypothetical protein